MAKPKLGIIYGGRSVEHGVSINSARNIAEYTNKDEYEVQCIGISKSGAWYFTPQVDKDIEKHKKLSLQLDPGNPCFIDEDGTQYKFDVIFPVLHGTDGEDGSIQGIMKALDIPMIGTGVLGSAMSMSKLISKQLMASAGIPVSKFLVYRYPDKHKIKFEEIVSQLGLPFMVKSASLGSSVGVSKVKEKADFQSAIDESFRYDDCLLIEEFIKGREIECAILGNDPPEASLPGEIIISKEYEFYTFDAKYVDGKAVTIDVPAKLDKKIIEEIRSLSLQAYKALHCEDFSRIDLFLTDGGKVYVNEINTIPGFTNSSMFPMMWKERGVSFTELISKLIILAIERFERSKRIEKDFQSALKF